MIAITMGDPAGIGPEVIAKSLCNPSLKKRGPFLIIGDYTVFRCYKKTIPSNCSFLDLKTFGANRISIGKTSRYGAQASLDYLSEAFRLLKAKKARALVTAPVSKEAISSLGQRFKGHTEYIADYFNVKKFAMMFAAPDLRVVVVTRHIPLKDVSLRIHPQLIFDTAMLTIRSLQGYFKIRQPKIAVCGINPHAGEQGLMGQEEIKTVIPAIRKLQKLKFKVTGPLPADTLFYPAFAKGYDAIIAMYHDQGLTPIKALYFDKLVNVTLGLPFIRTSPAHGTAFNIAGKNKADPSSMRAAIELAAKFSR